MSDAAKKCADWLRRPKMDNLITDEERIDQAADEKYRSLVEAVELCLSTGLAHGQVAEWLREALLKVKEG